MSDPSMSQYNQAAFQTTLELEEDAERLRVGVQNVAEATVIDLGVDHVGGLVAGELLADTCLGGAADVFAAADAGAIGTGVSVRVATDDPLGACLGCQYAGWPLSVGDYFAMASGPIRLLRGREEMLQELNLQEQSPRGVVVLESDTLPSAAVVEQIAKECQIDPAGLTVLVAPTTSIAGNVQVVARSIETAMHKLHELKFDVRCVRSALGSAPLPPPATRSIDGIGRTNDAILYGACVSLFVDAEQSEVDRIGPQIPSSASRDFGKPFGEIFKEQEYDFYKIDPMLFSPAVVTIVNLRSGISRRYGQLRSDILATSFGVEQL